MVEQPFIFVTFLIFFGAALLATVALYARQAMIVAYIFAGVLAGPHVLGLVTDAAWIEDLSEVGIMFLLYLLGLNMEPRQLWRMLGEALGVTLLSSVVFFVAGLIVMLLAGWPTNEAVLVGAAMMFSSTIIGLKLLPTTTLHHRHTGQLMISVLLAQDLLAILVLVVLQETTNAAAPSAGAGLRLLALPLLLVLTFACEKVVLEPLIARFDQIQEYLFLLVIGWCLAVAEAAAALGLSHEIGAFIAGVALATCPVAAFVADSLRPLRDFFLVMFFFALGAGFDLGLLPAIWGEALALCLLMLAGKPLVFRWLFIRAGERARQSLEVGVRLGQISEFSFLIAVMAQSGGLLTPLGGAIVKLATLLTFVISSYLIVMRYPTPIAVSDSLRRD
jgi:Kef-type K+ transport system membrane component KefB